ncbi:MAG: Holliday junction resolvase RuvX [Bacilli bacterium]
MKDKIIGLDLGTKTLGVAISDSFGMMAHGYETYTFKENHFTQAATYVCELATKKRVKKVVLGYPKNMDNSIGERAKMCERFSERLNSICDLEVVLVDERMTTMMANNILSSGNVKGKNKKKYVDKIAAQLILQSYLDQKGD